MLEWFERKHKGWEEERDSFAAEEKRFPGLTEFAQVYLSKDSSFMTPFKVLSALRYFRVIDKVDLRDVGEIGEYAAKHRDVLRQSFAFGTRQMPSEINHISIMRKDPKFLVTTYKKLHVELQHKNQYRILRGAITQLSEEDVKWFVRFLCRKVHIKKGVLEGIKRVQMMEE